MNSAHGTIHDDVPPVPQAFIVNDPILRAVDIEQQRELLRQAELRRVAAVRDQNVMLNAARQLRERQEEEQRVRERERLRQVGQDPHERRREEIMRDYEMRLRLAQARQLEDQERQRREQARRTEEFQERQRREERRRREQQDGGWGCTIM
ncbi:hypothetical protein BDN67DRAFT_1013447 [Paxillus ammoniavirescens]|nr:hypothetical protein BDN67DRAFT_1013447 [Paxillus ammoniavirescens]